MRATRDDLLSRAARAIERREAIALEAADEKGQIFDNVAHMRWFRDVVAARIASEVAGYRHLAELD